MDGRGCVSGWRDQWCGVVTVCGVRQDGCGQEVGGVCVQMSPEKPGAEEGSAVETKETGQGVGGCPRDGALD